MSKLKKVHIRPIPMGILVSVSRKAGKPKRLTPKRSIPSPTRSSQVPWLWIGVVAGVVVVTLLVVISTLPSKRHVSAPPITITPSTPPEEATTPIAQEKPIVMPIAVEVESQQMNPKVSLRDAPLVRNHVVSTAIQFEPIVQEYTPPKTDTSSAPLEVDSLAYANCTQIGTNVLFMKDPPEAFRLAKAENKLVFMLHLSGNFEDRAFT